MSIITLTTDFGVKDWFVGAMKGVILNLQPGVPLVDITHEIPAGNVLAGAFALASSFNYFPPGTVHLAVVDPGVGGERAAIVVESRNYRFVGPDNGVLSLSLARDRARAVHRIENKKLLPKKISRTFHGRDVFAPVAAYLAQGLTLSEIGPRLVDYERVGFPIPVESRGRFTAQVIYIDRFGNAITNLPEELGLFKEPKRVRILIGRRRAPLALREFYQQAEKGEALGILGSSGFLEVAINGGNAAERLKLKLGDVVMVDAG